MKNLRQILAREGITKKAGLQMKPGPLKNSLERILIDFLSPDSKILINMGVGEFSGKGGMQIIVTQPDIPLLSMDSGESDPDTYDTLAFQSALQKASDSLESHFGLPVHQEQTEESAVVWTIQLK